MACWICRQTIKNGSLMAIPVQSVDVVADIASDTNVSTAYSCVHVSGFEYRLNEEITINNFDPDLDKLCKPGIHYCDTVAKVFEYFEYADIPQNLLTDKVPWKYNLPVVSYGSEGPISSVTQPIPQPIPKIDTDIPSRVPIITIDDEPTVAKAPRAPPSDEPVGTPIGIPLDSSHSIETRTTQPVDITIPDPIPIETHIINPINQMQSSYYDDESYYPSVGSVQDVDIKNNLTDTEFDQWIDNLPKVPTLTTPSSWSTHKEFREWVPGVGLVAQTQQLPKPEGRVPLYEI